MEIQSMLLRSDRGLICKMHYGTDTQLKEVGVKLPHYTDGLAVYATCEINGKEFHWFNYQGRGDTSGFLSSCSYNLVKAFDRAFDKEIKE